MYGNLGGTAVADVRWSIGEGVRLMLDFNQSQSTAGAVERIGRLQDFDLTGFQIEEVGRTCEITGMPDEGNGDFQLFEPLWRLPPQVALPRAVGGDSVNAPFRQQCESEAETQVEKAADVLREALWPSCASSRTNNAARVETRRREFGGSGAIQAFTE